MASGYYDVREMSAAGSCRVYIPEAHDISI